MKKRQKSHSKKSRTKLEWNTAGTVNTIWRLIKRSFVGFLPKKHVIMDFGQRMEFAEAL
jgi:hypothetical protein